MHRSRGFCHRGVLSTISYNAVIVLSVVERDCCKPTSNCRDWAFSNGLKGGCQPFSCPDLQNTSMTHWGKGDLLDMFVSGIHSRHSLEKCQSSTPCQKLEVPESGSTLYQLYIMLALCLQKILSLCWRFWTRVSCREAQVGSRGCGLQGMCFFSPFAMLLQWVEIELLATVSWTCGCQPFSCRCSQHVTHCQQEICSTCAKHPLLARSLRSLRAAAHSTSSALWLHHLQLQKKTCHMHRSRGFGHGVVVSRPCWGIFRSPMFPCDHCKTLNYFGDWACNHGGLEVGLPAFQLPIFANLKGDCRWKEEICFTCLFRVRNPSLHSLPVAWCSWELVFYRLPPPVHHGDSFAGKECCFHYCHHVSFSPIASSQSQVGFDCERFGRCAAVPCDSALIRWPSIAGLPARIQEFAESDGISTLCKGSW